MEVKKYLNAFARVDRHKRIRKSLDSNRLPELKDLLNGTEIIDVEANAFYVTREIEDGFVTYCVPVGIIDATPYRI